jgi:hypothetical protein
MTQQSLGAHFAKARMVKKLKRPVARVKWAVPHEEQEVGATAGVRDGIGEPTSRARYSLRSESVWDAKRASRDGLRRQT